MVLRFVGLAVSALILFPLSAFALEPGHCGPAAAIQAALKAEGQVPVVIGNRVTTRKDRPVNIFTANSSGIGYSLEGDAPQGQKSTTVCVKARYSGLRLNDINSAQVPAWALIGNDTKAANDNCKATHAGLCESYDDYVKRATAGGMRVMLMARSEIAQPDGSMRLGRWLTILTKPVRKIADITATNSVGASESVGGLEDVHYTQFAAQFIMSPN
ncbi:hypothetical protein OOT33_00095 [Sphingobium sp. DEHP117]|uniref:hypothetical protein n=1 Tax=Sphingobium sp. DEHP117 TaxID=2993436 RepID=UPI0027D574EA|nr:hypothetical protein [Sphingobium sp. DEHP117]MDQ4418847.1 hypothetical protein [Sphingobium sp. DEHP117]